MRVVLLLLSYRQGWGWTCLLSSFHRLFPPNLTFLSLRSLSRVTISCLLLLFSILLPPFTNVLTQSSHLILNLHPLHFLSTFSLCQFFTFHYFHMSGPFQSTPHQFLLITFLHSNLHSQVVHSFPIRSLHSHTYSYPFVIACRCLFE